MHREGGAGDLVREGGELDRQRGVSGLQRGGRGGGQESFVSRDGRQVLQKHGLRVRGQQRGRRRQGDVRGGGMEHGRPRGGPAQVLRRKRGRRRRRGRPSLDRGRGLKGRGRGAGRRLQRAQAQRGTATHSPAADTGSKRMSRGRRHRVVKDTCKQERKQLQQVGTAQPKQEEHSRRGSRAAAALGHRQHWRQAAGRSSGHLPEASRGPPLGPACPPAPSRELQALRLARAALHPGSA